MRHQGLLVGVEFDDTISGVDVKHGCFDRKMLITAIGAHIIRMIPPLIVSEDCDKAYEIIRASVEALADKGKYRRIYDAVALSPSYDDFEPMQLVGEIRRLTASLGIPAKLSEVGVTEDKFLQMAADAMKSGNIAVNPRTTTAADIVELYKKAF